MLSVAVSLVGGLLFGYLFLDTGVKDTLDLILMSALDVMIFIAGIEIGSNRGRNDFYCRYRNRQQPRHFKTHLQPAQRAAGACHTVGGSLRQYLRRTAFGAYRRAERV